VPAKVRDAIVKGTAIGGLTAREHWPLLFQAAAILATDAWFQEDEPNPSLQQLVRAAVWTDEPERVLVEPALTLH
jgi:hypothetical protein